MNEQSKLIIGAVKTPEGLALERKIQGEFSFADMINIGFNMIEDTMNAMYENAPAKAKNAELKGALYDDINMRATALLDNFIPEHELPRDFTEEAQAAMANEDEYINLKWKALQYDKIIANVGKTGKIAPSVKINKKGEVE